MTVETDVGWLRWAAGTLFTLFSSVFGGLLLHAHKRISDLQERINVGDTAAGASARAGDDKLWEELRRLNDMLERRRSDLNRTLFDLTAKIAALPTRDELITAINDRQQVKSQA